MEAKAIIRYLLLLFLFVCNEKVRSSSVERDLYGFSTLVRPHAHNGRLTYLDAVPGSRNPLVPTYSLPEDGFAVQSSDVPIDGSETIVPNEYSVPHEQRLGDNVETNDDRSVVEDEPEGPPDHVIPYSEHENPQDVPTRPKYTAPGTWAKPPPEKKIPLDFVPTKMYAQVRGTHTVKRLPRRKAVDAATTEEERANAPRLRAVVTNSKVNTIYTEEGYEDSAYDHAGQARDADFHEGYARKLHDQANSGPESGSVSNDKKNTKSKLRKPELEELDENEDDYRYHLEGDREKTKSGSKIDQSSGYKESWKRPDLDPKVLAENGIERLEEDLKKEAEEAEKGSENYELRNDHDYENTNDRPVKTTRRRRKKKKNQRSHSRNAIEGVDKPSSGTQRTSKSTTPEMKDDFYNEEKLKAATTRVDHRSVIPQVAEEYEGATSGFNANVQTSTSPQYIHDSNKPQYSVPITTQIYNSTNTHDTTTVSYNDLKEQFWNLINSKENVPTVPLVYVHEQTTIPQPILLHETTTLRPQSTPVALATINGHGPFFLVTGNQVTTETPNPIEVEVTRPVNLADVQRVAHSGTTVQQNDHWQPGQGVNPVYPSTFAPYTHTDPALLRLSVYDTWRPNKASEVPLVVTEPSTSAFLNNFAFTSTPTYSVIALPVTDSEPPRKSEESIKYESNPFLNPEARAIYANRLNQHKAEYEMQTANDPMVNTESTIPAPRRFVEATSTNVDWNGKKNDEEMTFFRFAPDPKYSKVLNYIKNQQNAQSVDEFMRTRQSSDFNGKKNESNERDFTIAKPTALGEITYSDFLLNPYGNIVGRSSVSQESETSQKIGWNKPMDDQKQFRRYRAQAFKDALPESSSTQRDRSFRWNSRLASWLLPPAPNSRDDASNEYYRMSRYADPRYKRNFRQAKSYVSSPEDQTFYSNNRRIRARRKRFADTMEDVVIAYGAKERFDRGILKDEMSMNVRRTKRQDEIIEAGKVRSKRSLLLERLQKYEIPKTANLQLIRKPREGRGRRQRNEKNNEKLLNESPKIAEAVIEEEIKERFGDKNKNKDEEKEQDQVEIEVPELDYSEELEDVNDVDVATTTQATIDLKKYPFYNNEHIPSTSALKYVVNSGYVPRKTLGGMEFYDSRNKYMECDEVNPNLEHVVPDDEEPVPNRGPKKDLPRLRGLGDKLDCFKAKYFDENPLDNPLFFEQNVSQPTPPTELDPRKFASKLLQLPEENHEYIVQKLSKKPEHSKPRRRRPKSHLRIYKSRETVPVKYPSKSGKGRNVSVKAPRHNSGRSLMDNLGKTARNKRHRVTRKSTTTTTEIPVRDSTNPYQKQVYDDVIGTIKNLASLQGTVVPLMEPPTSVPSKHISTNSVDTISFSYVPNSLRERGTGFPLIDITKSSHNTKIEGLVPPPLQQQQQRIMKNVKIIPYKTDKVSYKTRARTESIPGDRKVVDYYKTVMVHKRSVNDEEEIEGAKMDKGKRLSKRFVNVSGTNLQTEGSRRISRRVNSEVPSTTQKPLRRRRKPGTLTTPGATAASTSGEESKRNGQKTVYTVRGRTRHSRNKEDVGKNGKFTAEQKTSDITTDVRRKEPRYSQIRRRKGSSLSSVTEVPEKQTETIEAVANVTPTTTMIVEPTKNGTDQSGQTVGQTKQLLFEESTDNSAGRSEVNSEKIDVKNGGKPKGRVKKYDVHENVQESTTTTSTGVDESQDPEQNSKAYLLTDPSGYSEAFADGSTESSLNGEDTRDRSYGNKKRKSDKVREDKNDELDKSEENESNAFKKSRSYKESDDERSDESKEITEEKDGEMKFLRYTSRPNSPAESFEDEQYSELGPRINKPAFYHPPFEHESNEKSRSSDNAEDESEEEEEGEEEDEGDSTEDSEGKERYVFPWSHDVEDEKEESKYISAYGRFEYPWEKRERLAKERKKKKERERYGKRSKYEYYDDDNDDGRVSSSTDHHERYIYPWERYDVPSKDHVNNRKNFWRSSIFDDDEPVSSNIYERFVYPWDKYEVPSKRHNLKDIIKKSSIFDNDEVASEYRPVAKFSSKYNSNKFRLPVDNDPIVISTVDSDKIRESIVSFMNEEPVESTTNYPIIVSTTTSATQPTLTPTISMRVSNARIIPENITTAPRKQNREKITLKSGRTKLRTSFKTTTTEPLETFTKTREVTSIDPLRKQIRSRVRATKNNLAKAESQIATSTVKTIEPSSSVTKSAETTSSSPTKSVEKYLTRRRGNTTKAIPKTTKSEVSGSRVIRTKINRNNPKQVANSQETKSSRRRTRPLSSGIAVTSATIRKKHQGPDKTSVVDPSDRTTSKKSKPRDDDNDDGHDHDENDDDVHRKFEDSTPTSRTVEHHSRVSKEEIITKTFYPEDAMYELHKNKGLLKNANSKEERNTKVETPTSKQPKKTFLKNQQRSVKESTETNPIKNEHVEKVSIITKETPDHVYQTREIDKDGVRGMYISITPNNNNSNNYNDNNNNSNDAKSSPLLEEELNLKNVEMEELERRMEAFNTFDRIGQQTDRDSTDDDIGSILSSDSYVVGNLLRKAPLRSIDAEETDGNESEDRSRLNVNGYRTEVVQKERGEEKREQNRRNKEKKKPSVNFIKEPDRRLYYYVQSRK